MICNDSSVQSGTLFELLGPTKEKDYRIGLRSRQQIAGRMVPELNPRFLEHPSPKAGSRRGIAPDIHHSESERMLQFQQ
jgi:hypothetical protein